MPVPTLDLKTQYRRLRQAIDDAIRGVLESGRFVLGPNVGALEEELATFLGVRQAIGLASGTDALHLAIRACRIGAGTTESPIGMRAGATCARGSRRNAGSRASSIRGDRPRAPYASPA